MIASVARILTIAHNTLLEALRQKVLFLLLLFSLVCVGSANFFTGFAFEDQIKFVKDFSFGSMSVFGLLLATLGAAQMLPAEIENRTIYTILSKPIRRVEVLLGKYCGLVGLIVLAVGLMTAVFLVVLHFKEHSLIAEMKSQVSNQQDPALLRDIDVLRREVRDPGMVQAWLLVLAKLALTAALATFISTFATSQIFTVAATLLIFLIGHLQSLARQVWLGPGGDATAWHRAFSAVLALLVPDFGSFGILDDLLSGSAVPWSYTLGLLGYAGIYILLILVLGSLVFERREL